MTEVHERDLMICRACGREERASEGYPCDACGTFICQICSMRGVTRCKSCSALKGEEGKGGDGRGGDPAQSPSTT